MTNGDIGLIFSAYIVAEAEATRLAEKEKARFYILEAIEYVEPQPMPVIKVKL